MFPKHLQKRTFLHAPPVSVCFGARFLMMILLVVLLCGLVLLCLQSWLKRCRIDDPPRRTVAVFAVGDLDLIYGELSAYFWIPLRVLEKLSLQSRPIHLKNASLLGDSKACIEERPNKRKIDNRKEMCLSD